MINKEKAICCKIEGCQGKGNIKPNGRETFSLGFCTKHYARFKKHGDPLYEEKSPTCCSIQGCQGKGETNKDGTETFSLGYCSKHYDRFKIHGDPLIVKVIQGEDRMKNPLYIIYAAIKQRCYDKNCKSYKDYGIRGICMCDEWLSDFNVFLKDMGERPEGYSIDRIDVNGNYCKENCKWATKHQQQGNTRRNNEIVGVYWNKQTKKWYARITINRETIRLGNFVNYEDACKARRDAEILYNVYNEKT